MTPTARYYEILARLELGEWFGEYLNSNKALRLPYHNAGHAAQMIEDVFAGAIALKIQDPLTIQALVFAAIYHDWGHSGGMHPDNVNVHTAIQHLHDLHRRGWWPTGIPLRQVEGLLHVTQYPYIIPPEHLTLAEAVIRDADLMSSARWMSYLQQNLLGLSAELRLTFAEFLPKQREFLINSHMTTPWGKRAKEKFLPQALGEIDALEKFLLEAESYGRGA